MKYFIDNINEKDLINIFRNKARFDSLYFRTGEEKSVLLKNMNLPIKYLRDIINIYVITMIEYNNHLDKYDGYSIFLEQIRLYIFNKDKRNGILNSIIKESYGYPIYNDDIIKTFGTLTDFSEDQVEFIGKQFGKRHIDRIYDYCNILKYNLKKSGVREDEIKEVINILKSVRLYGGDIKYWESIVKADLLYNHYLIKGLTDAKTRVKDKFGIFQVNEEINYFIHSDYGKRNQEKLNELITLISGLKEHSSYIPEIIFYCYNYQGDYLNYIEIVLNDLGQFWREFLSFAYNLYQYENNKKRSVLFHTLIVKLNNLAGIVV